MDHRYLSTERLSDLPHKILWRRNCPSVIPISFPSGTKLRANYHYAGLYLSPIWLQACSKVQHSSNPRLGLRYHYRLRTLILPKALAYWHSSRFVAIRTVKRQSTLRSRQSKVPVNLGTNHHPPLSCSRGSNPGTSASSLGPGVARRGSSESGVTLIITGKRRRKYQQHTESRTKRYGCLKLLEASE